MRHEDMKVLKSVARLEAERLTAFDEFHEIADSIDLAALAVIGMARELGREEGEMLANYLREQAERMRKAKEQLLTRPDEPILLSSRSRSGAVSNKGQRIDGRA
jgi:hypothetical protein